VARARARACLRTVPGEICVLRLMRIRAASYKCVAYFQTDARTFVLRLEDSVTKISLTVSRPFTSASH